VGAYWGPYNERKPEVLLNSLNTLISWFEEDKLAPHISASFSLGEAEQALALLYERKATGKVVLETRR